MTPSFDAVGRLLLDGRLASAEEVRERTPFAFWVEGTRDLDRAVNHCARLGSAAAHGYRLTSEEAALQEAVLAFFDADLGLDGPEWLPTEEAA